VGDTFDVRGGDLRVVDDIFFSSVDAGSPPNDNGDVLFTLNITDGTHGVFHLVFKAASAALVLTLAAARLVARRRRHR
jgi:hypothetical protein